MRDANPPLLEPIAPNVPVDFRRAHPIAPQELIPTSIFRRGGLRGCLGFASALPKTPTRPRPRKIQFPTSESEIEQAASRPRTTLLLTSKATLPYLIRQIPAVNTELARGRASQIVWHIRQGTFREVIVSQVLRPTTANGDLIVDPDDQFPESFRLQPIAEKRFGGRWIRISRVEEILPVDAGVPASRPPEGPK